MASERTTSTPDLEVLRHLEFPIVTYEVSREKLREYTTAIGDSNPLHTDGAAAREAGAGDLFAPPTFAAVFATTPFRRALADRRWVADSTLDYSRILHGEQRFDYRVPIHPGDTLIVQMIVDDVEIKENGMVLLQIASRVDNNRGDRVIDAMMTLVVRP